MSELKESLKGLNESIIRLKHRNFVATLITVFGTGFVFGIIVGLFISN